MEIQPDRTTAIRQGEELPLDRLETCLREHFPQTAGDLTVEQFPHGHSNLTYLLRLGSLELVLRRPPFGNQVKSAHDMGREFRVLSKLSAVYAPAPKPYFQCEDLAVIGAPFYVMERRTGVVLRKTLPAGVDPSPDTMRRLCESLIDNLAVLHSLDYAAAGLADLGKPDGYVSRQVNGWCDRYDKSRTDDVPEMDRVGAWLKTNQPATSTAALIHNDYKFDNLVLDPGDLTRIVAVLDWEMSTLGDPLMDLGSTLAYWIEAGDPAALKAAAMGPTSRPGCLTRQEIVDRYVAKSGRTANDIVFYYVFGLYKLAVIVQQIYARYKRGSTTDIRFAAMNAVVAAMSQQADSAIHRGSI